MWKHKMNMYLKWQSSLLSLLTPWYIEDYKISYHFPLK
ncbi:tryptophanase leader peptide [Photobacterium lipolyticum]|uniref:Tryptophanase leader peptide n=1 Tax=Photobacterium lipolyticum TaxID=266810 RepID=A0A2T3MQN4_9GAMM|nr:tryptophanase leader peptide [Photobacterium lipolyticum]